MRGTLTLAALACAAGCSSPTAPEVRRGTVHEVHYRSAADDTMQPAMLFVPESAGPVPLLVALHTWSGDYRQDYHRPCVDRCIANNWAFVHPDFRGPNRRPEATGSDLAVLDVVSAVAFVRSRVDIDPERIYLVGTSGGGHAALLLAGRAPELWAGVSAWCPVADLRAWHAECSAAGRKYAREIELSCGGAPGTSAAVDAEYARRSPVTWLAAAGDVALDINAGIHDGHTGSVPVTHALAAYDAAVALGDRIPPRTARSLVDRNVPELERAGPDPTYGDKSVLFRREAGKTRVTIFDGGHEIVFDAALAWLATQRRR